MGSLISKPKAPPAPQPVVMTAPAPAPVPAPEEGRADDAGETGTGSEAPDSGDAEKGTQKRSRTADLLRRGRGTGGTILTSFRGVLSNAAQAAPRKTLLGE